MQTNSTKKVKSTRDLTKDDVLRIWTLRAGGSQNKDIAKEIGCQPWVTSDVITHGRGPKTIIPPEIKKAALAHLVQRSPKVMKRKVPLVVTPDIQASVSAFVAASVELEVARKACIAAGINDYALDLLVEALKEQPPEKKK